MHIIKKSPTHLFIGGWKPGNIIVSLALLAAPVAIYLQTGWEEPWMMWATLFMATVIIRVVLSVTLWERIEFDTTAGEVRFDQVTPTGRRRRVAALKPVSRVELDIRPRNSPTGGRAPRRLALVTGHERTPFTRIYTNSARLDSERDELNAWLEDAFGDRWREAATRLRAAAGPGTENGAPLEGITRIRHPGSGLSIDVPEDWSASVRLDRRGPLRLFGVTLLKRFDRPGPLRHAGDGGDWNILIVKGAKDAGLRLAIHEGPLRRTLADTLEDPWSMEWGKEVIETNETVEMGGMTGFSIARRIPKGGSTFVFGKVGADTGTPVVPKFSADVATRQIWLGAERLHIEIGGMARIDDAEMQHALDAMFASIRLPAASVERPDP